MEAAASQQFTKFEQCCNIGAMDHTALATACRRVGGKSKLAKALGITPSAITQMLGGARPIPAERCPQIEMLTGVTCEELRPDLSDGWRFLRGSNSPATESSQ